MMALRRAVFNKCTAPAALPKARRGGPTTLSYEFIELVVGDPAGADCLYNYCSLFAAGQLPESIASLDCDLDAGGLFKVGQA